MKLVIAEKPSVGREIAKVIGATKRENGYFSGNGYFVSWCVGHLIQNAMPEDYNPELKKWRLEALPFIPEQWETVISENTKKQYEVIEKLIKSDEVKELICATDAGREGELIFRLVYNKTGSVKPCKRLWISSMESKAIKTGFETLKDSKEYDNLYQAALSRMNADFLVGINATRLYTCIYNKKFNIGRVQSPTINLIVKRQREIQSFVPQQYFTIIADCGSFKAYARVEDGESAVRIVERCNGKNAVVTSIERQDKTENAAALFDLTTLQREANRLLSYSAQQTLDIVQSLYEAKLSTYPRTDSRYLTEDMENSTVELINGLIKLKLLSTKTQSNYDISKVNVKRIINNKKVTDHHAIIPTQSILTSNLEKLSIEERNVLTLITYRLLTAPYAANKYSHTKLVLDIEGEEFIATGNQTIDMGFKEFQNHLNEIIKAKIDKEKKDKTENDGIPADIKEGSVIENVKVKSEAKKTKSLPPYTEATLLAAMENAGKELEDEELKEAMKDGGLGTPATRSGIIERIIKTEFIERKGKQLFATEKAFALMDLLPEKIKEPELTAEWERQLEQIKKGELTREKFMEDIVEYVTSIIESSKAENKSNNVFKFKREVVGICPRCNKEVIEFSKAFACASGKDGCGFAMWKEDRFFKDKKQILTKEQAVELLEKGKVKMSGLFSPKTGKTYEAIVVLCDTGKYVNYKIEFGK